MRAGTSQHDAFIKPIAVRPMSDPTFVADLAGAQWTFTASQSVPIAALVAFYLHRVRRLRRRRVRIVRLRIASFLLGAIVLVVALSSPIDALGEDRSQWLHMTQHILLGDVAPLLVVLGSTGALLAPVLRLPGVGRLRELTNPLVALPIWATNLLLWHTPALYDAALRHNVVHAIEHLSMFWAGCLFWAALFEPLPGPAWFTPMAKVFYVLLGRLVGAILANVLMWSGTAFYPYYASRPRLWGMSALESQNLAGITLLSEGMLVSLLVMGWFFFQAVEQDEIRQRLLECGVDRRVAARAVRYGRGHELLRARTTSAEGL